MTTTANECRRCEGKLNAKGRCKDETCPFTDYAQDDAMGFADHRDCAEILDRYEEDGVVWKNKQRAINTD